MLGWIKGKNITGWDGSQVSCGDASEAHIDVSGLTGGDSYVVEGSLDGTNWRPESVITAALSVVTSITSNGAYIVTARRFIRLAKTGSASTPTVFLALKG